MKNKSHALKKINRQWIIWLFDLAIYSLVSLVMLAVYRGTIDFGTKDVLFHYSLGIAVLTVIRLLIKIYKQMWRFGGIQCYIKLLISDCFTFIIIFIANIILCSILNIKEIPFPRMLAIFTTTLLGSLAIRMFYRYAYKCHKRPNRVGRLMQTVLKLVAARHVIDEDYYKTDHKIRIAIVGAGNVGVCLAEELLGSKNSAYIPVCFIDTNRDKIGQQVVGLNVLAEGKISADILNDYKVQEIVLALPRDDDDKKKNLYSLYTGLGFKVKSYDFPTMQTTGSQKRHLREFDIEELLFRAPLDVINEKTSAFYKNKTVLITGGGGSIGSELCRQIARMSPQKLIILDVYENGAYDVQQELCIAYGPSLNLCVEILSVCNRQALEKVFNEHRPQVVIHAAAHKHVPLMERNCCEAIENNVFGTLNTVELSEKYKVERFMMVSTDKAVNPTNVMGATKRMCELIVQSHSITSAYTTYSATRFGNVLGSAGSVIPLFKKQIFNGGPVTITDKRIIRYFMTIPEASQLVLQSASMAKNGELFVLDMGRPVKILELAENMIKLSGYEPYKDIDIIETGLRPGEKLYEELLVKTEELDKTENSLIFIERDEPISVAELNKRLAILSHAVDIGDDQAAKEALHKAVPTFKNPEVVNATAMETEEIKMAETASAK